VKVPTPGHWAEVCRNLTYCDLRSPGRASVGRDVVSSRVAVCRFISKGYEAYLSREQLGPFDFARFEACFLLLACARRALPQPGGRYGACCTSSVLGRWRMRKAEATQEQTQERREQSTRPPRRHGVICSFCMFSPLC
jgi:hypothetical protein